MVSLADHLPPETFARLKNFLDRHSGEAIDGTMYVLPSKFVEGETTGPVVFATEPQHQDSEHRALAVELGPSNRVLLVRLHGGSWGGRPIAESLEHFLDDPAWTPGPPA